MSTTGFRLRMPGLSSADAGRFSRRLSDVLTNLHRGHPIGSPVDVVTVGSIAVVFLVPDNLETSPWWTLTHMAGFTPNDKRLIESFVAGFVAARQLDEFGYTLEWVTTPPAPPPGTEEKRLVRLFRAYVSGNTNPRVRAEAADLLAEIDARRVRESESK